MQRLHKNHTIPTADTTHQATDRPRRVASYWWKVVLALLATVICVVGLIAYRIIAAVNTSGNDNRRISAIAQLGHLVLNRDAQLRGEPQDRVNILLLGIGGEGHDGPLLTDTIILASLKPSTGQVALLSIPRDLAVEIPGGYGIRKINSANAYGRDQNYPGGGEQLVADIVAKITGQTIQYFGRIDFAGFENIVNDLGGITVTVEQAFVDREYPTEKYGYQTIRFAAGKQTMDGATALKFVRSRHGSNGEGSDFARSHRQQLVLEAVRDKAFSLGTIMNPLRIGSVLSSLGTHTRTNAEIWELLRMAKLIHEAPSGSSIITRVLDDSPTSPLRAATGIDGAYLLVPKDGSFEAVKQIATDIFTLPLIEREAARIAVLDDSGKPGTGKRFADHVTTLGIPTPNVLSSARRATSVRATSQIFDLSNGRVPVTLQALEAELGIAGTTAKRSLTSPLELERTLDELRNATAALAAPVRPQDTDLLIVLGQDATELLAPTVDFNVNTNRPTNTNVNANANTNAKVNKNSNTNAKTNRNASANRNSSRNTNANANANENVNASPSINSNTNAVL